MEFLFYAIGYWFARRLAKTEKLLRITESARREAEFNHLRTQINPHFLFNTLNTFYSQSLLSLPDTAKGISLLSKIMRYSLEPPGTNGLVPLGSECEHANDYMELMELRFPGIIQIHSNIPRKTSEGWQILPHVIITLVENAFKHGSRDDPFIFDLRLEGNNLRFTVQNTVGRIAQQENGGVGLKNLTERLQHIYGNKCSFTYHCTHLVFTAVLIIEDARNPFANQEKAKKIPLVN